MNPEIALRLRWIVAGFSVAAAGMFPASAPAAPAAPAAGVRFLSGFSGQGRLEYFANQQDDLQEERYVTEGAVELDFVFVSFGERWAVRSRFCLAADLGDSVTENLPFSPKDVAYEIRPFAEYQRASHLYRFGWEHVCQHLIYKDHEEPWYIVAGSNDVPPDVYYNRLFVGAGRREIRPEILWQTSFGKEGGAAPPRAIWYVEAGGYLRSVSGMDADSFYGGNDWVADLTADLRLRVFTADRWMLFATSRTQLLLDGEDDVFARERLRLEAVFDSRAFGSSVYLGGHVVDEHPRDSKEGIVELGAAFYF